MTILDMIEQSGIMALVGMGVVFSFLIILVIAITISSSIIRKFDKSPAAVAVQGAAASGTANEAVTAAITAAVKEYRKNN